VGIFLAVFLLAQTGALASTTPIQLTNDVPDQGRPDVRNGIITWKDKRHGNFDIYLYSLFTGTEEPVMVHPAYQNVPATNGSVIVWQDDRNGQFDIYMRDLDTGIEHALVTGDGNQGMPAIDGNDVVYVDDSSGSNDIYMINLATRVKTPIATQAADQWQPRISDGRIIWEDERNGHWDIYLWDIFLGVEMRVTDSGGDERVSDIDGDLIVWQDYVDGQHDIRMKDLKSGVEQLVTDNSDFQNSPRVSKDLIVWEDYNYATANYDVKLKDLTSGVTSVLAGGRPVQARPAIDIDTVVWEQSGLTGFDIWMVTVPDTTPPDISGLTPQDGGIAGCQAPLIQAAFKDNRVGVGQNTVEVLLDGEDVTAEASISDGDFTYQAPALSVGTHSVSVNVSDLAGNEATRSWQFEVPGPEFGLGYLRSYWASPTEFINRILSVDYRVSNLSNYATAAEASIVASTSSSGVILDTDTPLSLGAIEPGFDIETTLKYDVPMSVWMFTSRTYMSCEDPCGVTTFIPEVPPG
jgi:beta propeller repeat protein